MMFSSYKQKKDLIAYEKYVYVELHRLTSNNSVQPVEVEMFVNAYRAQRNRMKFEIEEFESLTQSDDIRIDDIHDLPGAIVKARLLSGYTIGELAEVIDVPEQELECYESREYNKVSLERMVQILDVLGVEVSIRLKSNDCKVK